LEIIMKTHLSLATRDLAASVAFYSTLLGAQPVKKFDDYALFITEQPALELALDRDDDAAHGAPGVHFGLVVNAADAVDAQIERLRAAGHAVDVEREETCCYAVQTKVWAADPDGRRWETYFVHEDLAQRGGAASACCQAA
jgi:catechol 2,3-dioxygenase-like lactoylglutathione lyase family enzyme